MGRDLKFRAWDKVAKKFLQPWPDGFHILGETTCFDLIGMQLKERSPEKATLEMLNDVEIEQYTGRKDKKSTKEFPDGQEVYEGDILAQPNDQKAWEGPDDIEGFTGERITVGYDEKLTRFLCHFWTIYGGEGYSGDVESQQLSKYIEDGWEVIGNIYENPELLK